MCGKDFVRSEKALAALPPDVRKGTALPKSILKIIRGSAPNL